MAQSDITIDALDKVGKEDAEYLVSLVRSVPGFPKEGILFHDIMPMLQDPEAFHHAVDHLAGFARAKNSVRSVLQK